MSGPEQAWIRTSARGGRFCNWMMLLFVPAVGVSYAHGDGTLSDALAWAWGGVFLCGNAGIAIHGWHQARRERALQALSGDDP